MSLDCFTTYILSWLTLFFIIINHRASEGPVHERLDNDAVRMKQNAQRREEEKLSAEMDGHTFRPHVPESSLDLLRKKTGPESEDGRIHDRLNSAHTVSSLGVTVTGPPSPPPQSSVMDR